jgi:hypothetical protein
MIPSKDEAMRLINEAYDMNPGPWRERSIVVAENAYRIAMPQGPVDIEKRMDDVKERYGY